ncbi:MAG TPA: EscU/YscU/HrcU family type III secretion system export apparatus switch protein [Polyangiaceae bacterium]|jgi:FlhB-like protein|nr:EscU/YscU/HrcU family type III secretion system export apparatus switch protein [Polyangiaceae bacterium]
MSDKTEKPSAKRLAKARAEGDSPVSAALSQSVGFVAALAVLNGVVAVACQRAAGLISAALARPSSVGSAPSLAGIVLSITVPVVAVAAAASAAASFVQTGGTVSLKKLSPNLDKLNIVTGLKGLFSWQRVVSIARALVAAALVGWFALRQLSSHGADFAAAVGDARAAVALAGNLASRVAWFAAAIGLSLGLVDLLLTRRAWFNRHRMSKDEIKREYRESEGDPAVKAARRRAHQEALTGATLGALKTASVVIVNPTHLATALKYSEEEDQAPSVVAQGQGEMAKQIIEAARAYGVPIVRDVPVARALNDLEIGDEIPEALYEAVAEILREIWQG